MAGISNKTKNKIKREVKKDVKNTGKRLGVGGVIAIILCLVVGVVGGIFAEKLISRNDCFVLSGDKEIVVQVGDDFTYSEAGYKCVSFGKDISDKVVIDTNLTKNSDGTYTLDTTKEGDYYMIYTVDSLKYGKIKRVRTFTVEVSNG